MAASKMSITSPLGICVVCGPGLGVELVNQSDIRECSASHDLIVASAAAVRVEVLRFDPAGPSDTALRASSS